MMSLFTVQIFKHVAGAKWSNVYHLEAASLATAVEIATINILGYEKSRSRDVVTFDSVRTSSTSPDDPSFEITPVNEPGDVATSGAEYLPVYNRLRADIQTTAAGRPQRKYYAFPIMEGDQANGTFLSGFLSPNLTALQGMIDDVQATATKLVSENGDEWTVASLVPAVQMRQLHRRRRRSPAP